MAVSRQRGLMVSRPGLLTSVQDLGRWGSQALGVPVSGAMDTYAHRLANALVFLDDVQRTMANDWVGD